MKLNEKSKQNIFEIVPIILFALALVIRFVVDIERLQWGLMEVAAILWLVENLGKYKKEHTKLNLLDVIVCILLVIAGMLLCIVG